MTGAQIYDQCAGLIWKLANQSAKQFREDAQDWHQELALEVLRFAHTYDANKGAPTTWVSWRHLKLVSLRVRPPRQKRTIPGGVLASLSAEEPLPVDARATDPARVAEERELLELVRAKLKKLPREERQAVASAFGVSRVAYPLGVAAKMGVTRSTVENWTRAGLVKLARGMGGDVEEVENKMLKVLRAG